MGVPALRSSGTPYSRPCNGREHPSPPQTRVLTLDADKTADIQPLSRALRPWCPLPPWHALVLCAESKHPASGFGLPLALESPGRPGVGSHAQSSSSLTIWLSISWGGKKPCSCHPLWARLLGLCKADGCPEQAWSTPRAFLRGCPFSVKFRREQFSINPDHSRPFPVSTLRPHSRDR